MLLMHNYQSLRYAAVAGLAAYSLIAAIESMGSMLMTGLAAGVQPLVSYFHGARKHRRKLRLGYYGLWTGFGLGVVMMIVSIAGYRIFPAWFGLDGNVASLAGRGLLISAPTFLLLGVVRVGSYYFQSSGRLAAASVLIYGDTCLALPLCLFILPLWLGIDGVWAAMPGAALCGAGLLLAPVQLERQTKGAGECLTEKRSNIWLNISNCGT